MNYFGMFFSFMIPGLILGAMAVAAFGEKRSAGGARRASKRESAKNKLYICDLAAECRERAA